ncbi:cnh domain containing [Anaeramoeba flamelloides]|uniref:Cnh domain containing n=1 Tax=Anaeramoeba flamelloides TaxID=1746091 RepID=A0ABQ8YVJ8_9EUKA|nr:cnh domain containing [Anaeramoeba flamelloides]
MISLFESFDVSFDTLKKINTVAATGNNQLFVGTTDGRVISYSIKREVSKNSQIYQVKKIQMNKIKKAKVEQLVVHHGMLFVVIGSSLHLLDLDTLEEVQVIQKKKVQKICVDLKPTIDRVCVCQKNRLVCYKRDKEKVSKGFVEKRQFITPECPSKIVWYGSAIFTGYNKHPYSIINYPRGDVVDLEINPKYGPLITFLPSSQEFLILNSTAEDNLGIFSTIQGNPSRSTMVWGERPYKIAIFSPFVISCLPKKITIHTYYDLKLLQTFNIVDVKKIVITENFIVLLTKTTIKILEKVPIKIPVKELITKGNNLEAIALFENADPEKNEKKHKKGLKKIYLEIGYGSLGKNLLQVAFQYFEKGELDPRELISLYPGFKKVKNFKPTNPFSQQNLKIDKLIRKNMGFQDRLKQSNQFERNVERRLDAFRKLMIKYFESFRKKKIKEHLKSAIDTTLIKLFAQFNVKQIEVLLSNENFADLEECEEYLFSKKLYHELAQLYKGKKLLKKSLQIWEKLGKGEYEQEGIDGIEPTIDLLSNHCDNDNVELIWTFSRWVLEKNPERGIKIFLTKRENPIPPLVVEEFLSSFPDKLRFQYIEFLVNIEKTEQATYHTQLAKYYISQLKSVLPIVNEKDLLFKNKSNDNDHDQNDDDEDDDNGGGGSGSVNVTIDDEKKKKKKKKKRRLSLGKESGIIGKLRKQLYQLLNDSDRYDAQALLEKIQTLSLYEERVVILDHLHKYKEALEILLYQIGRNDYIFKYCEDTDINIKQTKLLTLLSIILNPPNNTEKPNVNRAIQIINKYSQFLNPLKVIRLFPKDTPLSLLSEFLNISIRQTTQRSKTSQLFKNLRKMENLKLQYEVTSLNDQNSIIKKNTLCDKCHNRIGSLVFARFPNGKIFHFNCFDKDYICPVTKKNFKIGLD